MYCPYCKTEFTRHVEVIPPSPSHGPQTINSCESCLHVFLCRGVETFELPDEHCEYAIDFLEDRGIFAQVNPPCGHVIAMHDEPDCACVPLSCYRPDPSLMDPQLN